MTHDIFMVIALLATLLALFGAGCMLLGEPQRAVLGSAASVVVFVLDVVMFGEQMPFIKIVAGVALFSLPLIVSLPSIKRHGR